MILGHEFMGRRTPCLAPRRCPWRTPTLASSRFPIKARWSLAVHAIGISLTWFTRDGKAEGTVGKPERHGLLLLSADGKIRGHSGQGVWADGYMARTLPEG